MSQKREMFITTDVKPSNPTGCITVIMLQNWFKAKVFRNVTACSLVDR
jgi:hypothetical protein